MGKPLKYCLGVLLVLILAAGGGVCTPEANAQHNSFGLLIRPQKQCKRLKRGRSRRKPFFLFRLFHKKPDPSVVKVPYKYTSPRKILAKEAEQKKKEQQQAVQEKVKEEEAIAEREEVEKFENLPPPISEKHARMRDIVRENLKNHKEGEPIVVEPLYFITAQDEFAFVDMEPFLMAVEYAMQGRIILVEGHTDNRGDEKYNLELSMKRVARIQQLMHDIGVPEERISVIGYGESMPTYDNDTEEGRQKNRRVDFKVF